MGDNVTIPARGVGDLAPEIATDDVGGVHFQRVKLDIGGDGVSVPATGPNAPLLEGVEITGAAMPAGGAAGRGWLSAIWKAITDRLPAVLVGGRLDVNIGASGITQPISGTVAVSNLPGTQPISGTVEVSNLPATQSVSGTVTAETELSAARQAADNLALPIAPDVLATLMGYDGTTEDLLRLAATDGSILAAGLLANVPHLWTANGVFRPIQSANYTYPGGASGLYLMAVGNALHTGSGSFAAEQANSSESVLASAARVATTLSSDLTNFNGRGVVVSLDITATPNNAETLTLEIQTKGPVSGKYVTITAFAALVASALGASPTTETYVYTLYPGALETAVVAKHEVQGLVLPRTWRVRVVHSAAGSWTYSVGASVIL